MNKRLIPKNQYPTNNPWIPEGTLISNTNSKEYQVNPTLEKQKEDYQPKQSSIGKTYKKIKEKLNKPVRVPIVGTGIGYIPLMGSSEQAYYETTPAQEIGRTVAVMSLPFMAATPVESLAGLTGANLASKAGEYVGQEAARTLNLDKETLEMMGDVTGFAAAFPGWQFGKEAYKGMMSPVQGRLYGGIPLQKVLELIDESSIIESTPSTIEAGKHLFNHPKVKELSPRNVSLTRKQRDILIKELQKNARDTYKKYYLNDNITEEIPLYERMLYLRDIEGELPSPEALYVFNNYLSAMHRKRNYTWQGFPEKFDEGWPGIIHKNSMLLGFPGRYTPLFKVSHFAPSSLREGYTLINKVANSKLPTVFTVTDDLMPLLEKAGFKKVTEIPQTFNGETVNKHVMINAPVTKEMLIKELQYDYPEIEEIVEGLDWPSFTSIPPMKSGGYQIGDVISRDVLEKGIIK